MLEIANAPKHALHRKVGWRFLRILAAYAVIISGGVICGGAVNWLIEVIATHSFEFGVIHVMEGAVFGYLSAQYLGLLLCVPVSYCRFGPYVLFAAAGAIFVGVPIGCIAGYDGRILAFLASNVGFLSASLFAFYWEADRAISTRRGQAPVAQV